MHKKRRKFVIKIKQKRKEKIKKLKEKYLAAKTEEEKQKILAKVVKINPDLSINQFLTQE